MYQPHTDPLTCNVVLALVRVELTNTGEVCANNIHCYINSVVLS